jgi:DNA polymerase-1
MTSHSPSPAGRKKLILVDGYALIYRAYHALPPNMMTRTGEPTNAVLGFTQMLLDVLRKEQPDYAVMALDRGRSFRSEMSADYKATRPPMPDDLRQQIGRCREIIEAMGMPIFELEGFEADDVIGTIAGQAENEGVDVLVVTGDMDELQLVTEQTHVVTPTGRNRFQETVEYDRAAVEARYGFGPERIPDYKALVGDKSDNIPNVPGIGEKTATALIQQYGTIEEILAHLDEVKPARAQQALRDHAEQARQSKVLATIVCDVPLKLDLDACRVAHFDRNRLIALFRQLEFNRLLNKLPGAESAPAVTPVTNAGPNQQLSLFADGAHDSAAAAMAATEAAVAAGELPPGYHLITTRDELEVLVQRLGTVERFTIDTEGTELNVLKTELVGISVAPAEGEAYYINVGHEEPRLDLATVREVLGPVLAAATPKKDAHHAKYDMITLQRAGMPISDAGLGLDSMIAAFLTGELKVGLKDLAFKLLGVQMTPIEDLIGTGRNQISMDRVPALKAAAYAGADADMTYRLLERVLPLVREAGQWDLLTEIEMPLVPVLRDMEMTGIAVDVSVLKEISDELHQRLEVIQADIYELAKHEFNINSSQQLGVVLFEELQIGTGKKTKTGYSTAQEVLEDLRGRHPIVDQVIEYRQLTKLISTYVDALPAQVNPETGRVHTSYSQTRASTGRLSSSDPNLQNIPIRTQEGRAIRRAFVADNTSPHPVVARPAVLFAADYSQIELRILAHMTGEELLVEAFRTGQDIHAATAAELFGVPIGDVVYSQRNFAKRINFGILYGMGAFALSHEIGVSMSEAQAFIARYWARFPKIRAYMDRTIKEGRELGYVTTLLGRRRYIPELGASNPAVRQSGERQAINAPVQCTAAYIIKIAMINLYQRLPEHQLTARMLLQVHDELVFETPEAELPALTELVCATMESAYPMDVPLKVETKHGANWGAME